MKTIDTVDTLKVTLRVKCFTCQCMRTLRKSFKVQGATKESALEETKGRVKKWQGNAINSSCRVCTSIIRDVNSHN